MPAKEASGLISRTVSRFRRLWADAANDSEGSLHVSPDLPDKDFEKIRGQMLECLEVRGGEVSARGRAASLGQTYLQLNDTGKTRFLSLIAQHFGPDPNAVGLAIASYQSTEAAERVVAEANLREALYAPRLNLLTQFNALPQGVKFLVDMRADLLRLKDDDPSMNALDTDLKNMLSSWFDVGFLELKRLTWESPAAILEKLIEYESVHEIRSWQDLRNRLDHDRRLYAFFHPRMPEEPLIFVEVALTRGIARDVQIILDVDAPIADPSSADTAIFYSISNTQEGLRGISFGNFLIKRVVGSLQRDMPNLKKFSTLSPIPLFRRWLQNAVADGLPGLLTQDDRKQLTAALGERANKGDLIRMLEQPDWHEDEKLAEALKKPLMRLCARYLTKEKKRGHAPFDPVARFHLGNGARIEQLNWMGDNSVNGLKQSFGIMVNYLYDLSDIEENHEHFAREGRIATSSQIRGLSD